MPEPDVVLRAQQAGAALENAWQRWRVVHGLTSDPMPAVSSYVGYTIEEPWGQPRVVFGLAAQDAEQLASLLERYDDARVVYSAAGAAPAARELQNGDGARLATLSVPQQAPPTAGDQRNRTLRAGYEEPLYHMAAAAVKEATGRLNADTGNPPDDRATSGGGPDRASDPSGQDEEPMGSLTRAASAARAAAEARIKATMTDPAQAQGGERPRSAGSAKGPAALPKIPQTDVLEPLPAPGAAASDDAKASKADKVSKTDDDSQRQDAAAADSQEEGASQPNGEKQEPEQLADKLGIAADDTPKGSSAGTTRRSRMPKAPIPRISKAKRPGAAPGGPGRPERSGPSETSAQSERSAS